MRQRLPVLFAFALFSGLLLYFWSRSIAYTNGHFTYGLDDAYIHLAIAKELAFHGLWGNSSAGFSGVSSSLVWTVLLAALFKILGNWELLPFILNAVFDVVLLAVLDRIWRRVGITVWWRMGLFVLVFFVLPLASQPILGMEVSLQCLLLAVFFYFILFPKRIRNDFLVILFAFLLGGIRYECILIVELCAIGIALQGETKKAIAIGIAGVIPAAVYGLFAVSEGGTIIPNTLFLKSAAVDKMMKFIPLGNSSAPFMFIGILFFGIVLFFSIRLVRTRFQKWIPTGTGIVFSVTVITAIAQFTISSPEQQFERYRAYIYVALVILFGIFIQWITARSIKNGSRYPVFSPILLVVAIFIFAPKFSLYFSKTPVASKNIWDQQAQMARFVKQYCGSKPVVLVDIGAVSYYADSPVVDLVGLGTDPIARMRLNGSDSSFPINKYIARQKPAVAIIYPIENYEPDATWKKEGSIVIEDRYVCARDTVDFYAVDPSDAAWLRSSLAGFRTRTTSKILIY